MDELTIEDKAKRYDEVIEELRGLLEGIHEEKCDIMEEDIIKIFPELKESESDDERIRKALIEHVKGIYKGCCTEEASKERDMFLAWLEKQGEQKPTWSKEDERHFSWLIEHLGQSAGLYDNLIDWLKSLKERYTWKPSDEQIKVCKEVYVDILATKGFDLDTVNNELNRLEEKLKKLREE